MAAIFTPFGTAGSFTIRELTGQQRILTLAGRALPYRPYEVPTEQRAEFTDYPGNPIATAQVLGAKEGETTIQGMWKDRFIKSTDAFGIPILSGPEGIATLNGSQVADVMALVKLVEDFARQAQLLEVSWDEIVRRGLLLRIVPRWLRREDVEWEMHYRWISRDQEQGPVAFASEFSLGDLTSALSNALAVVQAASAASFQLQEAFNTALNTSLGLIEGAVTDVQNATINVVNTAVLPVDASRRSLASLQTIQDQNTSIIDLVESQPSRAIINTPDISTLELGQVLAASEYGRGLKSACRSMRSLSADQGSQLANRTNQQQIIGIFSARQSQDLRDVSRQFYGTQEEWKRIAQYNSIKGSKLLPGQTVLVPRLRSTGN